MIFQIFGSFSCVMLVCVGVACSTDQKICFLISKFSLKVLGVLVEPEVFPVFYFQETVGPSLLRIVKGPGSTFLMCIFFALEF